MIPKPRFTTMAVTVLVVLVLSAIMAAPVFADDGAPPPVEPTPEVVPVPPAEPVVAVDESAPSEPVTVSEALEQLPEGTDLQVVDESGEALPLATQEAADALVDGDPIWCPVGIAPKASTGGCSASYTSFASLITDLKTAGGSITNPAKAGVIWIEGSYNSSNPANDPGVTSFTLDGDDFTQMDNFALTLKGGWSGLALSSVINQGTPSTFTDAILSIINWHANVTLSDIVITSADSNTGSNDNALLIETTGNIQLDRVTVKDGLNTGGGAMTGATLDNSTSAIAGTVVVNNGVFENNEGDGLRIFSAGIVTITTLIADANDVGGAVIDNRFATTDRAVTLKGAQTFSNNGSGAGLKVFSDGLITISNIVSNANGGDGVDLDNTTSLTNQGVTISGTNRFVDNSVGLSILSEGVISLNNINASDNGFVGADLDNCHSIGSGCLATAKLVKLTGNNNFFNNTFDGLQIVSYGAITVNNLTASGNGGNGVRLDNQVFAPGDKESLGTITLTGFGVFNNNAQDGLLLFSHDNIVLTSVRADNNNVNGVNINADRGTPVVKIISGKSVTVSVATVTLTGLNYFSGNGADGLHVSADGTVVVSNANASYNSDDGADLHTTAFGSTVVVNGTNNFAQNSDVGLYVVSNGAITVSNITSTHNQYGAQLLNNINTTKQYNVTLGGSNSFNDNNADGLIVHSYGVITANNLTANGNGHGASSGNGATLDSCNSADYSVPSPVCVTTTAKNVVVTGYVNVSDNFFRGLQIYNLGAVTLSNALANNNGNVGVHINNQLKPTLSAAVVRTVTLNGTNTFNYNGSSGLFIRSFGAINLANINAYGNVGLAGAALFNEVTGSSYTVKNITITGVNSFIRNDQYGLFFSSGGAVSLTRINADGNDWEAADGNIGGGVVGTAKTITLTCGHMYGNGFYENTPGYNLTATGALTIKGIYSAFNGALDTAIGVPTPVITKACALP